MMMALDDPAWVHLNEPAILHPCRSRSDIEKAYIQQWKQTTARDGKIQPQTVWSILWFVPIWIKYHVVPDIVRYAWFIVWSAARAVYMKQHRWAVLQGAASALSHPWCFLCRSTTGMSPLSSLRAYTHMVCCSEYTIAVQEQRQTCGWRKKAASRCRPFRGAWSCGASTSKLDSGRT